MKKFLMYLFGIPVALYAMLMSYLFIDAYFAYSSKRFDSKAWKAARTRAFHESDRRGMYYDLRDNYLKKGMSYEEVEGLLGEWNIVIYCVNRPTKCFKYSMGGGGSSGYGNLIACFNRDGGLTAVGLDGNSPEFVRSICTNGDVAYLRSGRGPFCSTPQLNDVPCPKSIERW